MKRATGKFTAFLLCLAMVFSGLSLDVSAADQIMAEYSSYEASGNITEQEDPEDVYPELTESTVPEVDKDTAYAYTEVPEAPDTENTEDEYTEGAESRDTENTEDKYIGEAENSDTENPGDSALDNTADPTTGNEYAVNGDTEENVNLTLNPGILMYGEDGSNKAGNIDHIFRPILTVNGNPYVPDTEAGVDYKYFTDPLISESADIINFDSLESETLENLNAGTVVYVCARVKTADGTCAIAKCEVTIQKRKISITLNQNRDLEISKKDFPENGELNAGKEVQDTGISISIVGDNNEAVSIVNGDNNPDNIESDINIGDLSQESEEIIVPLGSVKTETSNEAVTVFARVDELQAGSDRILAGDVILDVSEVDVDAVGTSPEVPVNLSLSPEYDANYEIVINPVGYVYVSESTYYVTFVAEMNGNRYTSRFKNSLSANSTLASFMGSNAAQLDSDIFSKMGFSNAIYGWRYIYDGMETSYLLDPATYKTLSYNTDLTLYPEMDYEFTAAFLQKSSDNIYVMSIPDITYDGRSHVSEMQSLKSCKSSINDLPLYVYYSPDGTNDIKNMTELRYGKDYKVTYKNNKNASMKYEVSGGVMDYVETYSSDAQRPAAVITGQGAFKGFKTTAYFEILPYNFGLASAGYVGNVSGIKNSYELKGGKVSGIKPKVTVKTNPYAKTVTLKAGRDYKSVIYKYDEDNNKWIKYTDDPAQITVYGKYLYTAEGMGNYCGTLFGQTYAENFNDGSKTGDVNPSVCPYKGTAGYPCQFIVDDPRKDLANASIKITKKSVPYSKGKTYTGKDFGIKVTVGGVPLAENTDYIIRYDGVDFACPYMLDSNNVWGYRINSAVYDGSVFMANKYQVRIVAIGEYYFGSKTAGKMVEVKGIKIKASDFKLNSSSRPYDGNYGASTNYKHNTIMSVYPVSPDDEYAFNATKSGSNPYYYDYDTAAPDIRQNAVCVMSEYDKLPGTYYNTVYPFGPGVDHSHVVKVKFKRTAISMSKAVSSGLLSATVSGDVFMNSGGAIPGRYPAFINVQFNGNLNGCNLNYNGGQAYISDKHGDGTRVKFLISGNKKVGNGGVIYIQGDGKLFKGKAKIATFSIKPVSVTGIPVIDSNAYKLSYGSLTPSVSSSEYDYGDVLAMVDSEIAGSKAPSKPKVTLYQAYRKDAGDGEHKRFSLAKIDPKNYKVELTPTSDAGVYDIKICNSKTASETGYDFGSGIALAQKYTVFDKSAKIKSITVDYDGKNYQLPADSGSFKAVYTGTTIKPSVTSVTLSDGTNLSSEDYKVEYGTNVTVGKKTGSIKVTLKRNTTTNSFTYGGTQTFNFAITDAAPAVQ